MYKNILYYKHIIPPTRLDYFCGHLQGGTLQRMLVSLPYLNCSMLGRRLFEKVFHLVTDLFYFLFLLDKQSQNV